MKQLFNEAFQYVNYIESKEMMMMTSVLLPQFSSQTYV